MQRVLDERREARERVLRFEIAERLGIRIVLRPFLARAVALRAANRVIEQLAARTAGDGGERLLGAFGVERREKVREQFRLLRRFVAAQAVQHRRHRRARLERRRVHQELRQIIRLRPLRDFVEHRRLLLAEQQRFGIAGRVARSATQLAEQQLARGNLVGVAVLVETFVRRHVRTGDGEAEHSRASERGQ